MIVRLRKARTRGGLTRNTESPPFVKTVHSGLRLLLAILVILSLITADLRYQRLETTCPCWTRSVPHLLAGIPAGAPAGLGARSTCSPGPRYRKKRAPERENLVCRAVPKNGRPAGGNVRLRALLEFHPAMLRDDVVAELVGVAGPCPPPAGAGTKGRADGVFVGQPLIDADGLMGQIVEVSSGTSRALLITDATHSIPVQVNRNGVRAIAEGTGSWATRSVTMYPPPRISRVGDLLEPGPAGAFPWHTLVAVVTQRRPTPKCSPSVVGHPVRRLTAAPYSAGFRHPPPSTPCPEP